MSRLLSKVTALAATVGAFAGAPALRAQPVTIDFGEYACGAAADCPDIQAGIGSPVRSKGYEFYNYASGLGGPSFNSLGTWSSNPSNLGYANRPTNIGSSTALFGTGNGDRIEMYASSPYAFRVESIDFANLFRLSSISPPLGEPANLNIYFQYFATLDAYDSGIPDGDFLAVVERGPLVGTDRPTFLRTVNFGATVGTNVGGVTLVDLAGSASALGGRGVYGLQWYNASLGAYGGLNQFQLTAASGRAHQFTNAVAEVFTPEPATVTLAGVGLVTLLVAARRRQRQA